MLEIDFIPQHKLVASLFLIYLFWERVRSTFVNQKNYIKFKTSSESFFCATMVFLYITILLVAYAKFILSSTPFNFYPSLLGACLWIVAVWYRRSSIRALGRFWSIYRTPSQLRQVIDFGPYQYSRHPYYSASVLELVSYALMFQSWESLVITTLIYLPLLIERAWKEESLLIKRFKQEYLDYKNSTTFIFNPNSFCSNVRIINHIKQMFRITRSHGPNQLLRIASMNSAVKKYFRNYIISNCLSAFSKIGFLDELQSSGTVNIEEYCAKHHFDFRTLKIICDYLYTMKILYKRACRYSLSAYGANLIGVSRGVFDFINAYAPIFENLDSMILNQGSYGNQIRRRDEFVGRASAELAELFPFPIARSLLTKYHARTVLDLGSGSGDFLIGFCKRSNISGYGLDLSAEAVEYANLKSKKYGIEERVRFITGDILNLSNAPKLMDVDVITCMFVLHEFLNGKTAVVEEIFHSIKTAYPNKYILVCELTRCDLGHLYRSPSAVAEHHLFHYLSNQGLANAEDWRGIFKRVGLNIIEDERLDLAEQSIFLLK